MTKRKDNVTQPKIGLDIFSGAGGLSLGAEMAGIDVKYAIEINKSAAQTFRRNHKGAHVICDWCRIPMLPTITGGQGCRKVIF